MVIEREKYTTKVRPYVKEWYEYLWQGKLMGVKCQECGAIGFPPFPVCGECSGTDLEWVEMSGEGMLETFTYYQYGCLPFTQGPVNIGYVKLKEGTEFMSWVVDLTTDIDEQEKFKDTLPVPVTIEIRKFDEENQIAYPVFHLKQ